MMGLTRLSSLIAVVVLCVVSFSLGTMLQQRLTDRSIAQTDRSIKDTQECIAEWRKTIAVLHQFVPDAKGPPP